MATDYSDYEFLKIEVAERVATITINRPDSLDAVNDVVHHELERVWIDVRADRDINAIIGAVRKAGRKTNQRRSFKSGHTELIWLERAAMRVAEGESVETVAKELSLDCDVLRRWLKRR